MGRGSVTAPGKLMLCGEYVVLEGGDAVVCAVDRRARASWGDSSAPPTPEAAAARELAERSIGNVPHALSVDERDLRSGDAKLGLGSSAAKAACAAGAVFAWHGHDVRDEAVRRQVFECALAGHDSVSPGGSGADVAAAVFGGFLRFQRDGAAIQTERFARPTSLKTCVVWTGQPASTAELVAAVREFQRAAPERAGEHFAHLRKAAEMFVRAWQAGDASAVIEAASRYGQRMAKLGADADTQIMTGALEDIQSAAAHCGGAAKPSGAGGGDVAVGFFRDNTTAGAFEAACRSLGFQVLELGLGAQGLTAESFSV